ATEMRGVWDRGWRAHITVRKRTQLQRSVPKEPISFAILGSIDPISTQNCNSFIPVDRLAQR
ncbi:hypothetical protein, partial [Burkholderia sp. LMG 13014]|uniref:hypothetical protein n=1 Tax=Burkholderia sp. LMG 13014 TaxID=2709306 RepID=UPI0019630612